MKPFVPVGNSLIPSAKGELRQGGSVTVTRYLSPYAFMSQLVPHLELPNELLFKILAHVLGYLHLFTVSRFILIFLSSA
jgi:hypothetical protein